MDLSTQGFYDRLADEYHLIFGSWDEEVRQQGKILDRLLRTETGRERLSILDCSCGIGMVPLTPCMTLGPPIGLPNPGDLTPAVFFGAIRPLA